MSSSSKRRWQASLLGGLTVREAIERTWRNVDDHAVLTRAAAISFYAMAALVPFMGLVIILLAQALPWLKTAFAGGHDLTVTFNPLVNLLPAEAASLIDVELNRLRAEPPVGLASFGVAMLLWLSSSVFVEIIDTMHAIRGAKDSRPFWKRRLIAMVMTVGTAGIFISALITIVVGPQILGWLGLSPAATITATIMHMVVVIVTVYATFTLTIRVGSNSPRPEPLLTIGKLLGTAVMIAATVLLRIYAQNWGNYGATYGSLAGIMLLLTWLWLTSLALLVAASIDEVVDDASGKTTAHRATSFGDAALGTWPATEKKPIARSTAHLETKIRMPSSHH